MQALKQGAPVLGAAPRYDSDPAAQIERVFALASEFDVDLDLHLDVGDDPRQMHIYQVLDLTERYKRGGRVVAGHMAKLSLLPPGRGRGAGAPSRRCRDRRHRIDRHRPLPDGARARPRGRARRRRRQSARKERRDLLDFEQQRAERGDPVRRLLADPHGEHARQYSADRGTRRIARAVRDADRPLGAAAEPEGLWAGGRQPGRSRRDRRRDPGAGDRRNPPAACCLESAAVGPSSGARRNCSRPE